MHNTGPLGYLPQQLATTGTGAIDFELALCEELRSEMKNAMIVYVDIYAIKCDLISNFSDYGMIL